MISNNIKNQIDQAVSKYNIIGGNIVLMEPDITDSFSFGISSIESKIPMTIETLYPYGSIGKVFCGLVVTKLHSKGVLDINAPIVEYLPDLVFDHKYGKQITLKHLLSHSSGLPPSGKYWGPRDPDGLKRYMYNEIVHHQFICPPGMASQYSNTAICLAGYVAEALSGTYYDNLVNQYILDPLDMTTVTYDPIIAMTYPTALPHYQIDDELHVIHKMTRNNAGHPSGFVYGTIGDLAKLAKGILWGKYLTKDEFKLMTTNYGHRFASYHTHPFARLYLGHGLAFNIGEYRGVKTVRHGGTTLSFDCRFDLFPEQDKILLSMVNYYSGPEWSNIVLDLYDEFLDYSKSTSRYLSNYYEVYTQKPDIKIGNYLNVQHGRYIEIDYYGASNELEFIEMGSDNKTRLHAIDGTHYYYILKIPSIDVPLQIPAIYMVTDKPYFVFGGTLFEYFEQAQYLPLSEQERKTIVGRFKDPENSQIEEIIEFLIEGDVLIVLEDGQRSLLKQIAENQFICHVGYLEYEPFNDCIQVGRGARFFRL